MARPILLDTDVLIDFFRGHVKAEAFIDTYNDRIILSSIVVAELYAGVKEIRSKQLCRSLSPSSALSR